MKSQVSPVVTAVIVIVVVLLIGIIGYKVMGGSHSPGIENEEMRKKYMGNSAPGSPPPMSGGNAPNSNHPPPGASMPGRPGGGAASP